MDKIGVVLNVSIWRNNNSDYTTNLPTEGQGDVSERVDVSVKIRRVLVDEQPQDFLAVVVEINRRYRIIVVLHHKRMSMRFEESCQRVVCQRIRKVYSFLVILAHDATCSAN